MLRFLLALAVFSGPATTGSSLFPEADDVACGLTSAYFSFGLIKANTPSVALLGFLLVSVLSPLPVTSFLITWGSASTDGFVLSDSTGIENILVHPLESEDSSESMATALSQRVSEPKETLGRTYELSRFRRERSWNMVS